VGIDLNDDGSEGDSFEEEETDVELQEEVESKTSIEDLDRLMMSAIANEDYEIAAEIRDRINRLKGEGQE
jgi:protein-arginine kinase activator protein McsA